MVLLRICREEIRMNKAEAIAILEEVKMFDDSMYQYSSKYMDALNMAIEALQTVTIEHGKWKEVYEKLVKVPLFVGNYDAKNGSLSFMHGIRAVMEYIAYEVGKQEEFDEMFFKNILKSKREEE